MEIQKMQQEVSMIEIKAMNVPIKGMITEIEIEGVFDIWHDIYFYDLNHYNRGYYLLCKDLQKYGKITYLNQEFELQKLFPFTSENLRLSSEYAI